MTNRTLYETPEAETLPSGMYLGLFHGRHTPDEQLEDWGFHGPMIGPLTGFHVTYKDSMRIGFPTIEAAKEFFPDAHDRWVDLEFEDDCLMYGGKYYGDFAVHPHEQKK